MQIDIERTRLDEVLILTPQTFRDERGFFLETFREDVFAAAGLPTRFVQVNHSGSVAGVVRGLHFQWDPPMGKLMRVIRGEAFLVAVDIRPGSTTLGQHVGVTVTDQDHRMVWAPASFARGFAALGDWTEVEYLCTGIYDATAESSIRWDDLRIGIDWPVSSPFLSDKDRMAQSLDDWLARPEARSFALLS